MGALPTQPTAVSRTGAKHRKYKAQAAPRTDTCKTHMQSHLERTLLSQHAIRAGLLECRKAACRSGALQHLHRLSGNRQRQVSVRVAWCMRLNQREACRVLLIAPSPPSAPVANAEVLTARWASVALSVCSIESIDPNSFCNAGLKGVPRVQGEATHDSELGRRQCPSYLRLASSGSLLHQVYGKRRAASWGRQPPLRFRTRQRRPGAPRALCAAVCCRGAQRQASQALPRHASRAGDRACG